MTYDVLTLLGRRSSLIVFDWDGTAVASRREDAAPVRKRLERLLALGVWIVAVTGTSLTHVDRQLTATIPPPLKRRLFVCANRGSEVYGFDSAGRPVRHWQRQATPAENRQLTAIAEEVAAALRDTYGLEVRLILNRMNRRKIDLIPLPPWADPPKSAIGELLHAVENRLRGAGLPAGLATVVELVQQAVKRAGLADPRITTDAKHVEIGLTDKGDAMRWAVEEITRAEGIPPAGILIAGDEFGPMGGLAGSDALMMQAVPGAVVASVGVEPTPVPPGVIHFGGGPAQFAALLDEQIALWEAHHSARCSSGAPPIAPVSEAELFAVSDDPRWHLVEEGFDVVREHEVEAIFAVANGAVGTQGGLAEGSPAGFPVTLVAGLFDELPRPGALSELIVAPNWCRRRIVVEGNELRVDQGKILDHRRTLDFRRGVLLRHWRHADGARRITTVRCLRFVSLADRRALVQIVQITPENFTGHVVLETGVDGAVANAGSGDHLKPVSFDRPPDRPADAPATLVLQTLGRGELVACATATEMLDEDLAWQREPTAIEPEAIRERWSGRAAIGRPYRFATVAAIAAGENVANPGSAAAEACRRAARTPAAALLAAHTAAWRRRWEAADVEVDGDDAAHRAVRLAAYHLIAAANPEDPTVSIGARGLTGEGYLGHVFWEAEIYLLPFYIYTWPEAARALLTYRFLTLPAARRRARALGCRGALWAWESTDTGEDATPPFAITPRGETLPILTAQQEHHTAAAVAYAAWHYWQATADDAFFAAMGAELIVEAARFWADRAVAEARGAFHIRQVIGPDEYHVAVDDSAYTNELVRWTLERAGDAIRLLAARWPGNARALAARLGLTPDEVEGWRSVAAGLVDGLDPASGLIEQFAGYFALEDLDLRAYEPRTAPMDVLLTHERLARTQVIKQADVVLLLYLLWDRYPPEVRTANFRYYEPRTAHGSSLSPSICALVAARLGDVSPAERYFAQAGAIDLENNMGNAAAGVHLGALGGLWQAAVFGFGGVRPQPETDSLTLDPHVPPSWQALRFPLQFRRRHLRIAVEGSPRVLQVRLEEGVPLTVQTGDGQAARLTAGETWRSQGRADAWGSWEKMP